MIDGASFSGKRVAVIGDVILDRYWWGDVSRISPEAPVPVVRLGTMSDNAGGAANVAANIAGLGAEAILIGAVGDDDAGNLLRGLIRSTTRVEPRLFEISGRPTTVKTRIVANHQHVVRVDNESTDPVEEISEDDVHAAIHNADVIVISDYAKGFLTGAVLSYIFKAAGDRFVIVDPKSSDLSRYYGANLITPNAKEAEAATGMTDTASAGEALIAEGNFKAALITEGERGMTLFEQGSETFHLDASALEVFDVTGAGDTVVATLAAATAAGIPLRKAAELANIAAGIAVSHVGTTVVSEDMLRAAMAAGSGVRRQ
ncbi:MAG: D-glycero-beta-D-manno-heptose-7-phosphate kinase [Chloracidobacterium sp.]|nr:D-glycero-beta-D-manno-heptose-7-phosphate kinase [Chloracidobacterium sp.]MCC6824424.1 D-glycero-beta-D-manno-heptose-7-phosphate kinase [Acidobacteriota bacterium]MCO5332693.1 D-glycero-beta-D-manno-heptose-7-phosphate kinase [Pyrinomonadaceae bacterium]